MAAKPSYLGLLNAIAVGESRGDRLLRAWAGATADADLRRTLEFVASREREHGAAFAKRIAELGYRVRERADENFDKHLQLAGSSRSDRKKFKKLLGYRRREEPSAGDTDPLTRLFEDTTIDPATGALLGRFIAEERDSERLLREAWRQLRGQDPKPADDARALSERLAQLNRSLAELKALRDQLGGQSSRGNPD